MTILNNHPKPLGKCDNCDDLVYDNNGILYHDRDGNIYCNFKGEPTKTIAQFKESLNANKR